MVCESSDSRHTILSQRQMQQQNVVDLFIVRHGERSDEAAKRQYRKKAATMHNGKVLIPPDDVDSLDPILTAKGYQQAHQSFAQLLPALEGRNVAVFSSPMRSAVGTVLMMGSASANQKVTFPISRPNQDNNRRRDDDPTSSELSGCCIPITILNELGNFAPDVSYQGGVETLQHCLPCLDAPANSVATNNPLTRELLAMPSHMLVQSLTTAQGYCHPVSFWKYSASKENHQRDGILEQMSSPISPLSKAYHPRDNNDQTSTQYPERPTKEQYPSKHPLEALDRAVELTLDRGCTACIVVAHREAIKELAMWCSYMEEDLSVPYCGIGCFRVAVFQNKNDHRTKRRPRYEFFNFFSHLFITSALLSKLRSPICPGFSRLLYMKAGRSSHVLCEVQSALNVGHLSHQLWLSRREEYSPQAVWKMREGRRSSILELPIAANGCQLNHFVQRLVQKDVFLTGYATWMQPDGRDHILYVSLIPQVFVGREGTVGLVLYYD